MPAGAACQCRSFDLWHAGQPGFRFGVSHVSRIFQKIAGASSAEFDMMPFARRTGPWDRIDYNIGL